MNKAKPINNCKHYQRNCKIQAPCCNIWFDCRLCHDKLVSDTQLQKSINPDFKKQNHDLENQNLLNKPQFDCTNEKLDRFNIKYVLCKKCNNIQPPQQKCNKCNIVFGQYFCSICNLFSNDPTKNIFHCQKCGICVLGKKEEMFHCDICGICLPLRKQNNHKCIKDALDRECPICLENLKHSAKPCVKFINCGHWLHKECFQEFIKQKRNICPICSQVILKQTQQSIKAIDYIVQQSTNQILQNTSENQRQYVKIICNECNQISENVLETYTNYYKCKKENCGSYNTKLT